jgi:hypothetical protein
VGAVAFQAAVQLDGIVAHIKVEQGRGTHGKRINKSLSCSTRASLASSSRRRRRAPRDTTHESRSRESSKTRG